MKNCIEIKSQKKIEKVFQKKGFFFRKKVLKTHLNEDNFRGNQILGVSWILAKFVKISTSKIIRIKTVFAHLLNSSCRNWTTNTVTVSLRLLSFKWFKYSCFRSLFCSFTLLFRFTTIFIKPRLNAQTHISKMQNWMAFAGVENFLNILLEFSKDFMLP